MSKVRCLRTGVEVRAGVDVVTVVLCEVLSCACVSVCIPSV